MLPLCLWNSQHSFPVCIQARFLCINDIFRMVILGFRSFATQAYSSGLVMWVCSLQTWHQTDLFIIPPSPSTHPFHVRLQRNSLVNAFPPRYEDVKIKKKHCLNWEPGSLPKLVNIFQVSVRICSS